jgi:hypothetical protein
MIDLNHGSGFVPGRSKNGTPSLSERINARIDNALLAAREAEPPRHYVGASMLGDVCQRRVAYKWRGETGEPIEGRSLRIFETGHILERLLVRWIQWAGFNLVTLDPETGEQYAFSDGPIAGHADGILHGGPNVGLEYPVLWEAKGLNDRVWNDIVKRGLKAAAPTYYGQANLYMAYLDLGACLFSGLNKNTQEIHHELITFDQAEAQRLVDLAVDIVGGWLPPRMSLAPTRICAYCQFQNLCWENSP